MNQYSIVIALFLEKVNPLKDPIISRNPFWSRDEVWKERRNDFAPAMTPMKLKPMLPLIFEGTKNLVKYINTQISMDESKTFVARDILSRYTCDTAISCILGVEAHSFESENPVFFEKGMQFLRGISISHENLMPGKVVSDEVENFLIKVTKDAINLRNKSTIDRHDFLSHIISLRDKKSIDDVDAAAIGAIIFLDGFETTAIALIYALYELAKNERIQQKLRKEIEGIRKGFHSDSQLSFDSLLELPYLDQVFYETLRLHPPTPFTSRICSEDIEVEALKDHKVMIKKDALVWIPVYSIHRDPGNNNLFFCSK